MIFLTQGALPAVNYVCCFPVERHDARGGIRPYPDSSIFHVCESGRKQINCEGILHNSARKLDWKPLCVVCCVMPAGAARCKCSQTAGLQPRRRDGVARGLRGWEWKSLLAGEPSEYQLLLSVVRGSRACFSRFPARLVVISLGIFSWFNLQSVAVDSRSSGTSHLKADMRFLTLDTPKNANDSVVNSGDGYFCVFT